MAMTRSAGVEIGGRGGRMGCEQRPPAARRWVYERLSSVVPCECSALKDILQIGVAEEEEEEEARSP